MKRAVRPISEHPAMRIKRLTS